MSPGASLVRPALIPPALLAVLAATLLAGCASSAAPGGAHAKVDAPARLRMADDAAAAGNNGLATTLYTRALADPALATDQRIHAAEMLVQFGHAGTAEAALTERLDHPPTLSKAEDTELRRALARLHIVAGQAAQALSECDALLARDPADMAALVDKAVALDLLGRHGAAQELYHRALAASPNDATVLSDLALSEALQGRVAEAAAVVAPLRARADLPEREKTVLGLITAAGNNPGNDPGNDPAPDVGLPGGRLRGDADVVLLVDAMRARAPGQGQ